MSKETKFKEGQVIGQAIVVEGDNFDVFGNPTTESTPMVLESCLTNSATYTKGKAKEIKANGMMGRTIICKLVFVEEIKG